MEIDVTRNNLLSRMPAEVLGRLRPAMKLVKMPLGSIVYEADAKLKHVFFPTPGCIVSMPYVMADGASAEIAVVGHEGMVGTSLFMGGETTLSRAVVQSAGEAIQLTSKAMQTEFNRHADIQLLVLKHTRALVTQMSQTAVCNHHHSVEQQLCRWLLLSLDRLPTNVLTMPQELIPDILGVRAEGVTEAAHTLQTAGFINYSGGCIKVIDRPQLEQRVCECYGVVRREYDRLLPHKIRGQRTGRRAARGAKDAGSGEAEMTGQTFALPLSQWPF